MKHGKKTKQTQKKNVGGKKRLLWGLSGNRAGKFKVRRELSDLYFILSSLKGGKERKTDKEVRHLPSKTELLSQTGPNCHWFK